jgi:hypothetical protein
VFRGADNNSVNIRGKLKKVSKEKNRVFCVRACAYVSIRPVTQQDVIKMDKLVSIFKNRRIKCHNMTHTDVSFTIPIWRLCKFVRKEHQQIKQICINTNKNIDIIFCLFVIYDTSIMWLLSSRYFAKLDLLSPFYKSLRCSLYLW